MNEANPEISVVIPCYNEEENLAPLLEELVPVMERIGRAYEILLIDDGSTDGTAGVLSRLGKRYPALRAVRLVSNSGQTAAFAAGFHEARGATVVTMDADLQNNPADIPRLLELSSEADVVCGVRHERHDSFVRRVSSRVANAAVRRVLGTQVTDIGCSLKVFRKRDVDQLVLFDGMHRFFPTLLELEGCRVREVEVDHRPRRRGTSKYNIRNRLFRALADLLVVWWMRSRRLRYEIEPGRSE